MVEEPIQFVFRTAGESKMRLFATACSYLALLWHRRKFGRLPASGPNAATAERRGWDSHWVSRGGVGSASSFGWISRLVRRVVFQPAVAHFLARPQGRPQGGLLSHPSCADISSLPFRSMSVDGVWNLGVMEHFSQAPLRTSLQEFERVLKPGGTAVLFWPGEKNPSRWLLAPVEWAASKLKRRPLHFFPKEVSRLKSRREAEEILRETGFEPLKVHYSVRTWFIHTVVIARKRHGIAAQCAGD